jgi:hypothetical protein
MSDSDWALMFRVKDSELAARKLSAGIDFVNDRLQKANQTLMIMPADVDAEGFRRVTHPMAMMLLNPVIGVKNDWLMIGNSPAPINKCLAVAAGKAPSIRENERFKAEGLIPTGPVVSASFKDTAKFGDELGQAVAKIGMLGGMVVASSPDQEQLNPFKQVMYKLMGIIAKLGPVVQKIDFYSSESSVTTYDGGSIVRTEKVVTYKPAPANDAKTARAQQR